MFAHRELEVGDPAAMLVLVAHTEAERSCALEASKMLEAQGD